MVTTMTKHWHLDDIDWDRIEPGLVDAELLATVKTAALVEGNSQDYVRYLHNVFSDDLLFLPQISQWGAEEAQHGKALGRWAEAIDAGFEFAPRLDRFREGYQIPINSGASVRGSLAGELLARCVVESGTCSFYAAIRDHTREPILRQICHYIAQDEARHYQLFFTQYKHYRSRMKIGILQRLRIALGRVMEADDDELAFAYFSANTEPGGERATYDRRDCWRAYQRGAMGVYRRAHVDSIVHMVARAVGVDASGWLTRQIGGLIWWWMKMRNSKFLPGRQILVVD